MTKIRGWRKFAITIIIAAIATFAKLSETQADVLINLTWASLTANAAVNITGSLGNAISKIHGRDTDSDLTIPRPAERPKSRTSGRVRT